jgi:hypothetical protein
MGPFHVDAKGNLYLYLFFRPKDVAAKLDPNKTGYGSIIKINPQERWVKNLPLPLNTQPADPDELGHGMVWANTNIFVPHIQRCYPNVPCRMNPCCTCKGSRFDLDEYGRLYLPGGYDGNVIVLDNAGNTILNLATSVPASPQDAVNKIVLGVPTTVSATRKALYVFDSYNHKVDRIGIRFADRRTVSAVYSGAAMVPEVAIKGPNFRAHPNPFNPSITFSFVSQGRDGKAVLSVYDVRGALVECVLDRVVPQGLNEAVWTAGNRQSGVYFVKLQAGGECLTRKIILSK